MTRKSLTVAPLLLLALAALPAPAWAQEEETTPPAPDGSWAFGLGAASDNRAWGASRSNGDAYGWALAEWASADGAFYAGPAVETLTSNGSDVEVSLFAGWRPQVAGFDLDLGVTRRQLIDAAPGADDDSLEVALGVVRGIGPVEGRLTVRHTADGLGPREGWTWYELGASWDQTPRLSWSGAVGRREQEVGPDYTGWSLGATWRLSDRLELDGRWHDTDADGAPFPGDEDYDERFVVGLAAYF